MLHLPHFRILKGLLLVLFLACWIMPQKPAYRLFTKDGDPITYQGVMEAALQADVVLFGELHNNPICHWLQRELAEDLWTKKGKNLVLAAEMMEADDQIVINEYLQGKILYQHFEKESKLWNNFDTDYKPLLDLAEKHTLPFIASNIPRRYASLVSREGLESLETLSEEARQWIAPLPITVDLELPAYANMLKMMGDVSGHEGMASKAKNFAYAQAVKDATMAHFILESFSPGKLVLHFNGSYHSDNFESIYWYLKKKNPSLKIVTLSCVEQKKLDALAQDYQNRADFIIAIPETMTKTY